MQIVESELFCPTCRSYVHPFLERCPACGATRPTRFADILAEPDAGLAALGDDPHARANARDVIMRYTVATTRSKFTSGGLGAAGLTASDVRGLVQDIGAAVAIRSFGCGPEPASPADARIGIAAGRVALCATRGGTTLLSIAPANILATTAIDPRARALPGWTGVVFKGVRALPRPAIPIGSLLITFAASDGTFRQLSIANRTGFLASRARSDHFSTIGYWLGILAAIEAEARWLEVGVTTYAAELGLLAAPPPAAWPGGAGGPDVPGESSVRAALEDLDAIRAAGLVTTEEYEAKRREILARL